MTMYARPATFSEFLILIKAFYKVNPNTYLWLLPSSILRQIINGLAFDHLY